MQITILNLILPLADNIIVSGIKVLYIKFCHVNIWLQQIFVLDKKIQFYPWIFWLFENNNINAHTLKVQELEKEFDDLGMYKQGS